MDFFENKIKAKAARDFGAKLHTRTYIIVDECHHISAFSIEKAVRESKPKYKSAGKTDVRVYDYEDSNVPVFVRMFEMRKKGYDSPGYEV